MTRIVILTLLFTFQALWATQPTIPVSKQSFQITTTRLSGTEIAIDQTAINSVVEYELKDDFYSISETISGFQTDSLRKVMEYYQSYWQQ